MADPSLWEKELPEKEERLLAVINNVIEGIVTINEDCIVQLFNPAAEKIFGYTASEVIGQNVNILMDESCLPDLSFEKGGSESVKGLGVKKGKWCTPRP